MPEAGERMADDVRATLDHELLLIREAIAMVASGHSPRVVLAGIQYGEALLDPGRRLAREAGVRVTPLWRADEAGADLAVERVPD